MLKEKIEKLLSDIHELEKNPPEDSKLPQNTYYLSDDEILCLPREFGEARYPYDSDGLVVWAHSTGYIAACESEFTIFKTAHYGEDPSVNFWAGIKNDKGEFFPVSLMGADCQLFEPEDVKRYVVYSLRSVYYLTETKDAVFAVRMHVDKQKHIHFAVNAINRSGKELEFYITSFIEALLRFKENESFWDRMSKFGRHYDNGSFILKGAGDYMVVNKKIAAENLTASYFTAARSVFLGYRGRTLTNAQSLKSGKFVKAVDNVNTTELPVACEINHFKASPSEYIRAEFELIYGHGPADNNEAAEKLLSNDIDTDSIDKSLSEWQAEEKSEFENLEIKFSGWKSDKVNSGVMNRFIKNIQKQTSFCALGKNYAGPLLGVRDVFQQLEGSLIWQPERSREKIVTALNYILADGRAPRQISIPPDDHTLPTLALEKYIDQGVWIISTIYTYLTYTGDYSILDEMCSYYELNEHGWVSKKSDEPGSVLDHMLRIMNYLISNIDTEYGTNCLRVLFGDWNDAVDGLGRTKDPDKEFGSGVTVMATLQLYQNLSEMSDILEHIGKFAEKIPEYTAIREKMEEGLFKHAVDSDGKGNRRIIHGWGDKMSYKVGSFNDCDGKARISLTSNSFWAISGIVKKDKTLKKTVLDSMRALDSKYGLKTFDKPFGREVTEVGRIRTITPGTYENSCAYVHAGMFAIMGLFSMGEPEMAWEQMEKSIIITHDNASMTPFVMPNSFCENPEYNIDGESMGDWYTGSGTVFVKELVRFGLGIYPTLDGLTIQTPNYIPADTAEIALRIKGCDVVVKYSSKNGGKRKYTVNGVEKAGIYDDMMDIDKLYLDNSELNGKIEICIE